MQLLRVCVYIYIYMGENGQMLLLKKNPVAFEGRIVAF